MITAVGVVIPARDEAARTPACLRAVRHALLELPPSVDRAVCLVADRCTDDTAAHAAAAFSGWRCGLVRVNNNPLPIGEVRDLGIRTVRRLLHQHQPAQTLLLSTDADTTVT